MCTAIHEAGAVIQMVDVSLQCVGGLVLFAAGADCPALGVQQIRAATPRHDQRLVRVQGRDRMIRQMCRCYF